MKRKLSLYVLFSFIVSFILFINGSELKSAGSKADAIKMVDKAVAYYKANGRQKVIDAVNKKNGLFHKGDVYVYLLNLEGAVVAHPLNPSLIGQDSLQLRDPEGKYFVKEIVSRANEQGGYWVSYKWPNPETKKMQTKEVYCKKVDDIIFICGIYI
jgi:cytochrome c